MLDCIVIAGVDVTFDLLHRRDTVDTVITTWTEHFDPLPTGFDAQPHSVSMPGAAVDFAAGDKLVFRFSAANTTQSDAWIPNGDGRNSAGRIPNISLPE